MSLLQADDKAVLLWQSWSITELEGHMLARLNRSGGIICSKVVGKIVKPFGSLFSELNIWLISFLSCSDDFRLKDLFALMRT